MTIKHSALRDKIKQLDDGKLTQLITELKFNTKLEQSALHYATTERRRRVRQAKAKAAS
jgi:hypothetical protein